MFVPSLRHKNYASIGFQGPCKVPHSLVKPRLKFYLHRLAPLYISDRLVRPLRSSGTGLLGVARVKCKVGEAAFSLSAPSCWNTLSDYIRSASA